MSDSIKIELYNLLKTTLEGLTTNGGSKNLFNYVGHYNGQDFENPNNFSFDTPAAFIALENIEWIHTKHETPNKNITREQDGIVTFSIHYFFHDLRTDTDSYVDHLTLVDKAYRALLGLRSDASVLGKVSSMRRIRETDDTNNQNLRHWVSTYTTRVQETGITAGKVDAQPVEIRINAVSAIPRVDNILSINADNDIIIVNTQSDELKTNN